MSRELIPISVGDVAILRSEFINGVWRLWLNADRKFEFGTFIELLPDGEMNRVVARPAQPLDIIVLCDAKSTAANKSTDIPTNILLSNTE